MGLDNPHIGILHTGKRNKFSNEPSFVLDLMEPYRPVIDREVIKIIKKEKLSGADFNIQKNGVCRLNPEMARFIIQKIKFNVIQDRHCREILDQCSSSILHKLASQSNGK